MTDDLDPRHLRAFLAVLEHGGATRAARALGVSQSTVSESLLALERALGATLLVRSSGGRPPRPTPEGEALIPHARAVLATLDAARAAVTRVTAEAAATVRVGTNQSVSGWVLPAVLPAMRRARPHVAWHVHTDACTALREGLAAGQYDVALLLEPLPVGGEPEARMLATHRLVTIAAPGHPLARSGATPGEVAGCDTWLSDAAGSFLPVVRRWLADAAFRGSRLFSAGSVEGVKQAVAADAEALGVLPAVTVADELRRGTLVEVALAPALPPIVLKALVGGSASARSGVEALVEALVPRG